MLVLPSKTIKRAPKPVPPTKAKQSSSVAQLPARTGSRNKLPPWLDTSKADRTITQVTQGAVDAALTEISGFYGLISPEYYAAEEICMALPMCSTIGDVQILTEELLVEYGVLLSNQMSVRQRIYKIVGLK